jgi:hypothetical protein
MSAGEVAHLGLHVALLDRLIKLIIMRRPECDGVGRANAANKILLSFY